MHRSINAHTPMPLQLSLSHLFSKFPPDELPLSAQRSHTPGNSNFQHSISLSVFLFSPEKDFLLI